MYAPGGALPGVVEGSRDGGGTGSSLGREGRPGGGAGIDRLISRVTKPSQGRLTKGKLAKEWGQLEVAIAQVKHLFNGAGSGVQPMLTAVLPLA